MRFPVLLRVAIPLAAVLLGEALLRAGAWEPWVEPASRIGATVALKREFRAEPGAIDIVTIGNSRALHGLDHDLLRSTARRHDLNHKPAILRGAHWVAWVELSDWIERQQKGVGNALIAVSVADLFWAGNGNHEVGMVEPLRHGLVPSANVRLLYDQADPETLGIWTSLLAYRRDLADYIHDPSERHAIVTLIAQGHPPPQETFVNNLCGLQVETLRSCAAHVPANHLQARIVGECRSTIPLMKDRPDWSHALDSDERMQVLSLRQQQVNGLPYRRPLVILMPVLKMWRNDVYPEGYQLWVEKVLEPMVASGRISLIDATRFFDVEDRSECEAFFDLYHQRPESATALTQALLPQIEALLYAPAGPR